MGLIDTVPYSRPVDTDHYYELLKLYWRSVFSTVGKYRVSLYMVRYTKAHLERTSRYELLSVWGLEVGFLRVGLGLFVSNLPGNFCRFGGDNPRANVR